MQNLTPLFAVFLLFTVVNCSTEKTYSITEDDGYASVHNHAVLNNNSLDLSLEYVQTIGSLESEDENYMFYRPWDVDRDSKGNIYINDKGNGRIQVFDSSGNYLKTMGSQGQGPGELSGVSTIHASSTGNLYYNLPMSQVICTMSPEGRELDRIKLNSTGWGFRVLSNGNFALKNRIYEQQGSWAIIDATGSVIHTFGDYNAIDEVRVSNIYNAGELEVDEYDNIYITYYFRNKILKYSDNGELMLEITRSLGFDPGVREVLAKSAENGGPPRFRSISKRIGIDHKNRIWVQSAKKIPEKGEAFKDYYILEVYNPDGVLIKRINAPQNGIMRIVDDRLFFTEPWDELCVYEYKIIG